MDGPVPDFASLHPGYELICGMMRILLAAILGTLATAAQAQSFATVAPGKEAWWLRTSFNPLHTELRGILVKNIRNNWCKATEFTRDLMPKREMEEEGSGKLMDEAGLSFSVGGDFDHSKRKQVALVGVYQTCDGEKGSFLLIIDEGTNKIRFVDTTRAKAQFAVLRAHKDSIMLSRCLECDAGATLRWNEKKKAFDWVSRRGH